MAVFAHGYVSVKNMEDYMLSSGHCFLGKAEVVKAAEKGTEKKEKGDNKELSMIKTTFMKNSAHICT